MRNEYPDVMWWQSKALDHFTDAEQLMGEISRNDPLPSRKDDVQRTMLLASIHSQLATAATQQQEVLMKMRELREIRNGVSQQEDSTQ